MVLEKRKVFVYKRFDKKSVWNLIKLYLDYYSLIPGHWDERKVRIAPKMVFSIKLACVVKLKLAFMEWFSYNLVILIKLYKIQYLNFGKILLFPKKTGYLSEKLNTFKSAATATKFNIFCWNFAHVPKLTMSTKACSDFFWFSLDLELLIKMLKTSVQKPFFFYFCK